MRQIQEGVFAIEETMPCGPRAIRLKKYALPSTLNNTEKEEAAARVLFFSNQLDQWVGVSLPSLLKVMKDDYRQFEAASQAGRKRFEQCVFFESRLRWYKVICALTLGLWKLVASKPIMDTATLTTEPECPFSAIFTDGPEVVVKALCWLSGEGLIRCETAIEGDKEVDVLFPTPSLINLIMERQGIPAC